MPYNGSGQFLRLYNWVTDAANGVFVSSSRTQADSQDMADNGLSLAITKDGQQTVTANIPFNGFKLVGVGLGTAPTDAAVVQNANALNFCEFRLTLTTGVPVTTSDVTAATTLFFTPYKGSRIALYDGTNWNMRTSVQMSIAVPATTSQMYDVFCFDNAGTPTLELLAWTNDTTRATLLTTQDGVLVKTGVLTRRYVGSFRTTTVSGQTEDSLVKRYVWNYYNRVVRPMRVLEATSTWNYTIQTIRQANGAATNQLDMVVGVSEDRVNALVLVSAANTNVGVQFVPLIGLDSTTAKVAGTLCPFINSLVANQAAPCSAFWQGYVGIGRHILTWLEFSTATGTTTWSGTAGTSSIQSGIQGEILG